MTVDQTILGVLDLIYAAAMDENLWPDVIRRIVTICESQAISFCVLDSSNAIRHPIFHYLNIEKRSVDKDRFMEEYLSGGFMGRDPTVQHIIENPSQRLVRDSALLSEAEKDRHAYYAWHGAFSDTRHRIAGMISPSPHIHSGITLHRTRQMGDFESSHVERFMFLLPHIERAINVSFQLGTLGTLRRAYTELFDANPRGIVFLDRDGRILFANRSAREIAASEDGLVLSSEGVSLLRSTEDRKLKQLMKETLHPECRSTGVMWAPRPSGNRHYAILVAPLAQETDLMAVARPAICVVITDPERLPVPEEAMLRNLFGFTKAEARLAARLAQGQALNEAAMALSIAYGTARAHLAAIFRKTGTNRQGELVRLLAADLPSLVL